MKQFDVVHVPRNNGSSIRSRFAFVNFLAPAFAARCILMCKAGLWVEAGMVCDADYAKEQGPRLALAKVWNQPMPPNSRGSLQMPRRGAGLRDVISGMSHILIQKTRSRVCRAVRLFGASVLRSRLSIGASACRPRAGVRGSGRHSCAHGPTCGAVPSGGCGRADSRPWRAAPRHICATPG